MRILLVDAMSVLYRAFYSSQIEKNMYNEPINAIKKFLYLIDDINRNYPCDDIIICEDAPRDTLYRQVVYSGYKKGRKPAPAELHQQRSMLFGFLRKIGFPVVGVIGYEADDIIGTLSRTLSADGHKVLIASPDKDMYQLLVNKRIGLIRHNPHKHTQTLLFRDDIKREFGYWPEQTIDIKILAGDQSDNIPGVPKCGFQGAIKIINDYGSIDCLISSDTDLDPIAMRCRDYIIRHKGDIRTYRDIITIDTNIDPVLISKQIAYRVDEKTLWDTMNRYQIMSNEAFMELSFAPYLMERLIKSGRDSE